MPTTPILTFTNRKLEPYMYPGAAKTIAVRLGASLTLAAGTVLGEVAATPGVFGAYATGNSDGTETAKAILVYDVVTDPDGKATFGAAGSPGYDHGYKQLEVPVYIAGYFKTTELTGLDAAGLADMSGRLVLGVIADGVISIQ